MQLFGQAAQLGDALIDVSNMLINQSVDFGAVLGRAVA